MQSFVNLQRGYRQTFEHFHISSLETCVYYQRGKRLLYTSKVVTDFCIPGRLLFICKVAKGRLLYSPKVGRESLLYFSKLVTVRILYIPNVPKGCLLVFYIQLLYIFKEAIGRSGYRLISVCTGTSKCLYICNQQTLIYPQHG